MRKRHRKSLERLLRFSLQGAKPSMKPVPLYTDGFLAAMNMMAAEITRELHRK